VFFLLLSNSNTNGGIMKRFSRRRNVCALVVTLGLTTASCTTQGRNPTLVSPNPRSLATTEPDAAPKAIVQTAYGTLPLSFEANQGQSDTQVKFLSRGNGYSLFLTPTEAVIALQSPSGNGESGKRGIGERGKEEGGNLQSTIHNPQSTVLRLQLVGANPYAAVSGVDELPGRVNYIAGQDQTKWHTNIPTYAKVHYESVYPGVDLLYYGNAQRRLEYDFHVAPGADPTAIRLKFEGVDTLEVDAAGDLVLRTAGGELRQQRPRIYQEVAGVQQTVAGGYVIKGAREVAFHAGRYDASRPLIIDPEIVYSTYLGGSGNEWSPDADSGNDITLDASGNIYVVGATNSLGRWDSDVLVRKFDPSGSTLLYETYLDSNGTDDVGYGIAVDAAGNAYVTGHFGDPWLTSGLGVVVAKLSPAGVPLYQTTFGASSTSGWSRDVGTRIAVDAAGNAYVVGTTFAPLTGEQPFPTTEGAFQPSHDGEADAFVVKLNPSGGFVYSTLLGGADYDRGWGIAINASGNAYVVGDAKEGFPTTEGALQQTFGGYRDVFITKLNSTGSALVYSTYLGGSGRDAGIAIALDASGNMYVTGTTEADRSTPNTFPVVNAFQPTYGGGWGNAFVAKLNSAGSALVYSSYMGGTGDYLTDMGAAIKADGAGYAYLTGFTETHPDVITGIGFPIVNAFQPTRGGSGDAFVTKLTPQGALVYSSYLGGSSGDNGNSLALGAGGTVYVTGTTSSQDFPITPNAFQPNPGGGSSSGDCDLLGMCPDAFVTKIADNLTLTVTKAGTGSGTVTSTPAGISCGADCMESYPDGTVIALTATPTVGSTFAGWSGDADCTDGSVTMNTSKVCTATFASLPPPSFTLTLTKAGTGSGTVTSSPGGISCGTDCTENYTSGTVVTLSAAPVTGATFAGWSGDVDCVDGVVSMTASKACTATFTLQPLPTALTVISPNGGETWPMGKTRTLRWTSSNVSGKVRIQLSRNGGASWTTLFSATANDGAQNWKVKGPATTQARLRVNSVNNPSVADVSDGNFTIQ
jgi:hypothetical protein